MSLLPPLLWGYFFVAILWGYFLALVPAHAFIPGPLAGRLLLLSKATPPPTQRAIKLSAVTRRPVASSIGSKNDSFSFDIDVHDKDDDEAGSSSSTSQSSWLDYTAVRWKMTTCYDADDGIFGLDTNDPELGIEIVKVDLPVPGGDGGLGINLLEFLRPSDRREMCVIESIVPHSHADRNVVKLLSGDTISFVNDQRTEGLNLDDTLEIISNEMMMMKSPAPASSSIQLTIKRLVQRQVVSMTIVGVGDDEVISVTKLLAGSNLRSEMQKRNIPPVYDPKTKRIDQPCTTGDCGGEGICSTCLVECISGCEHLSKPDPVEKMALQKYPAGWRLACRTIVGARNAAGVAVKFRAIPPQSEKRANGYDNN